MVLTHKALQPSTVRHTWIQAPGPEALALSPHLEDMEGLELDGAEGVLEQHHHELQILHVTHVPDHDLHVAAVQQDLAQQLHAESDQGLGC